MTSRLSRIPGGTQLTSSVLTFSLLGNTCYFQSVINLLLCLQNTDMFRQQAGVFTPTQRSLHISFEATDSIFGHRYSGITSCSKIPVTTQICTSPWTFHPTWRPAGTPLSSMGLFQTAQHCLQLQHPPKGCCSSWGLLGVHKWFKNPSRLASAISQACSPHEKQSQGELGARLLQLSSAEEFPPAPLVQRQWMQARGLAWKLLILDSGSPPRAPLPLSKKLPGVS